MPKKKGGISVSGYREEYFKKNPSDHGWYTCVRCGRKFRKGDMDIDHIIPQNRGGGSGEFNLQCLCKHCNRSKKDDMSDSIPDLFRSAGRIVSRESQKSPLGKAFKRKI